MFRSKVAETLLSNINKIIFIPSLLQLTKPTRAIYLYFKLFDKI